MTDVSLVMLKLWAKAATKIEPSVRRIDASILICELRIRQCRNSDIKMYRGGSFRDWEVSWKSGSS